MERSIYKSFFAWVVGALFVAAGAFIFYFAFYGEFNSIYIDLYKEHFQAIVGLPAAAFMATFLILLLKVVEKEPLEFSMIGVKFKGTSGEIILWVLVYLSIVASIKLLW
ncbi:MAG: hypothetical protein WA004_08535 [Saprospiraceae bacterium]